MKTIHVAAAQIHSGGGIEDTLLRMERQVCMAAFARTDVILFPEYVLQGYDLDLSREMVHEIALKPDSGPCRQIIRMAVKYEMVIIAGFFEKADNSFYNSSLIAHPDETIQLQRSHLLNEKETAAGLTPGPRKHEISRIRGVPCAVVSDRDCEIDSLAEDLQTQGVQYRFIPACSDGTMADMLSEGELRTPTGRAGYLENRHCIVHSQPLLEPDTIAGLPFATAHAVGPVGYQSCHPGHCLITDSNHVVRAQIPGTPVLEHQQDQMIHAAINFQ